MPINSDLLYVFHDIFSLNKYSVLNRYRLKAVFISFIQTGYQIDTSSNHPLINIIM